MDRTDCLLVAFAITFVAFISWVNLDERPEKPSNTPNMIHHGSQRKEQHAQIWKTT